MNLYSASNMSRINSRQKGAAGEREFANELRKAGHEARRGQQFSGIGDSPDVVSSLPFHFEVKRVEQLNLYKAMAQAMRDAAPGKPPVVAHRRNKQQWMVTMNLPDFLNLIGGKPRRIRRITRVSRLS